MKPPAMVEGIPYHAHSIATPKRKKMPYSNLEKRFHVRGCSAPVGSSSTWSTRGSYAGSDIVLYVRPIYIARCVLFDVNKDQG